MAAGRRESMRRQAIAIADCFFAEKKFDWNRFLETGSLQKPESYPIPMTPAIAREMDRIEANGGHFVLEEN